MGLCWSEPPRPHAVPVVTTVTSSYPCRGCGSWAKQASIDYCEACLQKNSISYAVPSAPPMYTPVQQPLQLYVRTLTGTTIPVVSYLTETVFQFKQRVASLNGIPPQQQVFLYMGKQLVDNSYLYQYGLQNGVVLHLVIRTP